MHSIGLSYSLYRLAGSLAPHVPPGVGYRLAEALGSLIWRLSPLRSNVEDNLSHILGAPPTSPLVRSLARQVYVNQCKNYFDMFRVPSLSAEQIRASVHEIIGIEHVDRALSRGHGLVLACAHFGNIDLAGQLVAIHGYRVTGLAEHLQPEQLFRYVCTLRESHGLRFIPIDASLRPIFRALRANEIVGCAIDRDVTGEGRLTLLFGQPARLPDGYLKLALIARAALILGFVYRLPDDRFRIVIEPEIELTSTGNIEHDILFNLPKALAVFERHLRAAPQQWVLFQRVWLPQEPSLAAIAAGSLQRPAEAPQASDLEALL